MRTTFLGRVGLRRTAAVAAVGLAASLTTAAVPGAAVSAPDEHCPEVYPLAELAGGDPVEGLTVTSGSVPTGFTGTIKDVLVDGIAPGVDMILADLESPELDRVGGIWEGMSGSPVYAEDGRLIGAVAYGLAMGASKTAGITPAAAMYELRSGGAPTVAKRTGPQQRSTAMRATQVANRFSALPVPYGVSGLGAKRLAKAVDAFGFGGNRVYAAGAAPLAADAPASRPVPGGNIAASMSYGDVSYVGTGTVTAVCGEEVIGFGHPMNFTGPTSLTMHNAHAIFIQEDRIGVPFKVANPSAPVGMIDQDRLAGILGPIGTTPATIPITSTVSMRDGSKSRTGETRATFLPALGDIAATHLMANLDRVFDGWRAGSAQATWTIKGTRPNGNDWTFSHADHWTDGTDITFLPPSTLYDHTERLRRAVGATGRIDEIAMSATLSEERRTWVVAKAEVRRGRSWVPLRPRRTIRAKAGSVLRLRVSLTSVEDNLGSKVVPMRVRVPANSRGAVGTLVVATAARAPLPKLAKPAGPIMRLQRMPRHSDLVAAVSVTPRKKELLSRTVAGQEAKIVGEKRVQVQIER